MRAANSWCARNGRPLDGVLAMIVDSHPQFWELARVEYPWLVPADGTICRTCEPSELVPQLRAAGVGRDPGRRLPGTAARVYGIGGTA